MIRLFEEVLGSVYSVQFSNKTQDRKPETQLGVQCTVAIKTRDSKLRTGNR
jgi:hypothetical protein